MIQLTCVSCGKKLRAKAELAGRMAKCPGCGQPIHIPADSPPDPLGRGARVREPSPWTTPSRANTSFPLRKST